ncbi:hypothetical protein B6U99_05215 [Candidatus Geothermarchaeota archaeon ex4572_27]|nr:MAG: hypothetical protein B6U99_05215 [Candidatus Geothermarchaeota archaeon ex4572_27]
MEMTLRVLREFGAKVDVAGGLEAFEVEAPQSLRPIVKEEVPGDYSAASFLAVAGAIVEGSRVRIEGLLEGDVQPDRMVVDVLREAGAKVSVGPSYLEVEGPSRLSSFKFDARDSPDLVPPLLALACFCDGESVIEGASRLRFKESDRLRSLPTELSRLGADVRVEGGRIVVRGGAVRGGVARSWSDHRVAMALAVVGLRAERGVVVEGFEAVSKSYPGFAQDLARLGASINVVG